MRLLELKSYGEFSITKNLIENIPPYAILSHTWGDDDEEVKFEDLMQGSGGMKAGYRKILFCGEQAARDGLQYCWVDTCCIDKSNNTELSEAINSMFRWYRNATKCYVYLSDVPKIGHNLVNPSLQSWQLAFQESRWFTRGWTLQELIAPPSVEFFSSNGKRLGDKKSLGRQLHEITGIAVLALYGTPLSEFSVKERMSWAENRQTKHNEDKAYSLLGIFDIHMPLIYGEGAKNAFSRFQEELDKRLRKHQLDELSTAIQAASNSTKRLKTLRNQSCSIPSSHDQSFLDPEPLFCSDYSTHSETQKEPVTRDSYSIDATTKQLLIDQLYFTKIDERLISLTAAQGTTCRWFLTKPEYASWHDLAKQPDHGGFLWIKGNPGTGKSTLIKLLFEAARLNEKSDSLQITLSFFFLARGTVEEKSTAGLYRSLLHQLFEKAEELSNSLEWLTSDGARVIQRNGWGEEALKQTLTHAVRKLGSRSLTIFIDALDECDKNQAVGMICFFEELCDCAKKAQVKLKVCLSSRHYPTIVIQNGIEVTLENEIGHKEDIKQFIRSKLRLGKSKQAELLRSEIFEKSSGIFLWVVLVLDILNSEYPDSLVSIKKIRERLKEIPPKLTDLFEMILTRDEENLERLQLCLKWILFATRPLKPQELYFAIELCLDKKCSGYWDQEDIELGQMKTYVRSSSKGLAEVTRNKASEVQFIHESVRDFLLSKYNGQWPEASGNFVGHSHEILRNCCLAQLHASINQEVDIPDPLPQASKAAQLRDAIRLKFPFLQYSVFNVFRHANSAQQNQVEQKNFLADFPLQQWIFFNNALERYDVRRYTKSVSLLYILAEKNWANLIRIHPQKESCFDVEHERFGLPILAALATGSQEAVRSFLEVQAEMHQEPLLHYLSKLYSENRNKRTKFSGEFTFSRKRSAFSNIAELGDEVVLTFLYALGKLDLESKDSRGQTPLSQATANGHEAIVKLLFDKRANLESKDNSGRTPLSWAAGNGHEWVVKLLFDKRADLESKDNSGRTPLSWAAGNGHEWVVKLLFEKSADLESKDNSGRTPLLWAAGNGREAVIKFLLEMHANLEFKDSSGWTPLSWATRNGREAVAKLLVENGADLESKNSRGQMFLSWAAENGHEAVVKMLLDTGKVSVAWKDENGRTLLSWGAEKGREAIVKMLLDSGKVDVDSKDKDGRTPLSWAVEKGHEIVVKMLLDTGKVDVAWKDKDGWMPLLRAAAGMPQSWAAPSRHKAVVKMLLDTGKVDVNSKDKDGRTPLSWAVEKMHEAVVNKNGWTPLSSAVGKEHEAIVKMLLDTGKVNLDSKDKEGQTLLLWAKEKMQLSKSHSGGNTLLDYQMQLMLIEDQKRKGLLMARQNDINHKSVMELLLATDGVNPNSKDPNGRTPLSWGAEKGHEMVVKMLLDIGKVDVDSRDKNGRTPLSWGAEKGCEAIVKMLLDTGKVDVDTKDKDGRTPLSWAAGKRR